MKARNDQWHPQYKTLSEWLAAEAGPTDLSIARPSAKQKRRLRLHKARA